LTPSRVEEIFFRMGNVEAGGVSLGPGERRADFILSTCMELDHNDCHEDLITHLYHDLENGYEERGHHEAIHDQQDGHQSADLFETTDTTVGAKQHDGNLEGVLAQDGVADLTESLEEDVGSRLELVVWRDRRNEVGMAEYSASETQGLVKADDADDERQGFGEEDGVHGDAERHGDWEGYEYGEDRVGDDGCG